MGKKSGPAAPPAPDPIATAAAQTQSNKETAIANAHLNRINQYTPNGNLTYEVNGYNEDGTPRYSQTQTLSASGQKQLDQQNALAEQLGGIAGQQVTRVNDAMNKPFDMSGMPAQVNGIDTSKLGEIQRFDTNLPQYKKQFADAGQINQTFGDAGQIQATGPDGKPIQGSVDFSGAPKLPGVDDFSAERSRVEDAMYGRATSRLDPRFSQEQSDMESALVNQGIAKGSDAWNREVGNFTRAKNDAYSSAMADAIMAGGQEQSRMFGLGMDARKQSVSERLNEGTFFNDAQAQDFAQALASGQFVNSAQQQQYDQNQGRAAFANVGQQQQYDQNQGRATFENAAKEANFNQDLAAKGFDNAARGQAYQEKANDATLANTGRQQAIAEQSYIRNIPINEIATLLGTGGGVNQPTFNPVANVGMANTDTMGAVYDSYNGNMNAWQQQQQARANSKGQMFGAIGTGAGLAISDRRMKHSIKPIGETWNGIKTYVFSYLGNAKREFGVMAQDILHIPGAVHDLGGVLAVDYRKVW